MLQTFLEGLWKQLEDDSSMVCTLLHSHLDVCKLAVERSVVCQIYADAMHPNGKADVSRDEVLSDHMLFGTVVATMLIVVVTAQGGNSTDISFIPGSFLSEIENCLNS